MIQKHRWCTPMDRCVIKVNNWMQRHGCLFSGNFSWITISRWLSCFQLLTVWGFKRMIVKKLALACNSTEICSMLYGLMLNPILSPYPLMIVSPLNGINLLSRLNTGAWKNNFIDWYNLLMCHSFVVCFKLSLCVVIAVSEYHATNLGSILLEIVENSALVLVACDHILVKMLLMAILTIHNKIKDFPLGIACQHCMPALQSHDLKVKSLKLAPWYFFLEPIMMWNPSVDVSASTTPIFSKCANCYSSSNDAQMQLTSFFTIHFLTMLVS